MTGYGTKFGRKQEAAIEALARHGNTEEAARAIGVSPQTLYRWQKIPEFAAACRELRWAGVRQAIGRFQKASGAAVTILLRIIYDPSAPPAARLSAAAVALKCLKDARTIEEVAERLLRLKRIGRARTAGRRSPDRHAGEEKPISAGHGSKIRQKWGEAIAALLTQRNVEDAARHVGIGTTTLYRWLRDPEFNAAWREARLAAYGQAGARLAQGAGNIATTVQNIMIDPASPVSVKVKATAIVLEGARAASADDVESWLRELRAAARGDPSAPVAESISGLPEAA
jgi:transposase